MNRRIFRGDFTGVILFMLAFGCLIHLADFLSGWLGKLSIHFY